ncbi:MAG: hypothetical protein HYT37_03835 [Candidatus Sungbacteria bacterium]|nr:hypothetical protein [Candidatus Sungbacteria bacterium]
MEKSFENKPENAVSMWKLKEKRSLSPLALQDFGKFLMNKPEHREGKMTCLQVSRDKPMEVRFFGEDGKPDDVFEIRQKSLMGFFVTVMQGNIAKISGVLEEFGFSRE